MSALNSDTFNCWKKRSLLILLIVALVALIYVVLDPFFVPIAWALVLAHISWPVHVRLKEKMGDRPTVCALIMVIGMSVLILLPLVWFVLMIQNAIAESYQSLETYLSRGPSVLPESVTRIPWLGKEIQNWFNIYLSDTTTMHQQLMSWAKQGSSQIASFFGNVGRNAVKALFTSIILFVMYRDGENILRNIKTVLHNLFGQYVDVYLHTAEGANRAIMFGVILIAIAQGVIASIGFFLFGVPNVALLSALTAIASIIPIVGTFLIWGPVSIWLLITDQLWQAIGMFVWGALLIGSADNLIRPLVISAAMHVSFLLVMFGIFGGIAAFGLIGLFVGPIVLAVALKGWSEWVQQIKTTSGN